MFVCYKRDREKSLGDYGKKKKIGKEKCVLLLAIIRQQVPYLISSEGRIGFDHGWVVTATKV